jgi:ParB-like chromosome segregation protein Spo0J
MTDIKIHPLAELFPLLGGTALLELADDIKANGQQQPILACRGTIIDGRNRLRACELAGVEPLFLIRDDMTEQEITSFVISANLHRRHLTTQQRAHIAAELANGTWGGSRSKGSNDLLPIDEAPQEAKPLTIKEAAAALNVSEPSVKRAAAIKRSDPEAHVAAMRGEVEVLRKAREIQRRVKAEKRATRKGWVEPANGSVFDALVSIEHCAIESVTADMVADASVDAIITDPPYLLKHLPEYSSLATFAERVLKPGGWCIVMTGVAILPEVFERLRSVLTYRWTIANTWPGGAMKANVYEGLSQAWKPILVLQKSEGRSFAPGTSQFPKWGNDVIVSSPMEQDKSRHKWQQSEAVFAELVGRFTVPGDLVVDPFAGSGTTGRAATSQQRRFWGCDIDEECATAATR